MHLIIKLRYSTVKKIIFTVFSICILFSCSNDDESTTTEFDAKQYPQKWQLIEMTGSIANVPPTRGNDMEWQEYYILQSNKTFIKSREVNSEITEATGTYKFITLSDDTYIELLYPSNNILIGNCTAEHKELIRVNTNDKLTGTWAACDGPGLFYQRIE